MRIAYLSEFDPAGLMLGHRDALRVNTNHECYVGVRQQYRAANYDKQFSGQPDVLVVCPGIGDGSVAGYGGDTTTFRPDLPDWVAEMGERCMDAKPVALFHGSAQTWAFRDRYARLYRERGFTLAATTLDYATEMDAAYLPPAVNVGKRRAPLRQTDDNLRVVQITTAPGICHTREFLFHAITSGASTDFAQGIPHAEALDRRAQCHAGFDHLRGSFSTATLEHAALGMVPLVGLRAPYRERLIAAGFETPPWPEIDNELDLARTLKHLIATPAKTRELQRQAREHFQANFAPELVAKRLIAFFEGL